MRKGEVISFFLVMGSLLGFLLILGKNVEATSITYSSNQEVCGELTGYDNITINAGVTVTVCAKNVTAGTGYWNVTTNKYGTINIFGNISGTGKGYAGGAKSVANGGTSYQGTSAKGTGTQSSNPNEGGGGGGNNVGSNGAGGGGGGGSGNVGGNGGGDGSGSPGKGLAGKSEGTNSQVTNNISAGGGGGNSETSGNATDGGNGGALIILNATYGYINLTGNISTNGNVANSVFCPTANYYCGAGGGGAGGVVMLYATKLYLNGTINAQGGIGGGATQGGSTYCSGGGGGSGGRVKIFYYSINSNSTLTTNVSAGNVGSLVCNNNYAGSAGSAGTIYYENTTNLKAPTPTYSLNLTNSTLAGTTVLHSLNWTDTGGNLSSYIFQFCNGTWNGSMCLGLCQGSQQTLILNESNKGNVGDSFVYNRFTTANYGTAVDISVYPAIGDGKRIFLLWNLSTIPAGATITNVNMSMNYSSGHGNYNVYAYNTSSSWTERNITWDVKPADGTLQDTVAVPFNPAGKYGWNVTNAANSVYSAANKNMSIELRSDETGAYSTGYTLNFTSKENAVVTGRPQLNITYIPSYTGDCGWVNDTWVSMTGSTNWSNVTKTVNSTVGSGIAWCVYANNLANNWNGSSCTNPFSYTTTSSAKTISITLSSALSSGILFNTVQPNNVFYDAQNNTNFVSTGSGSTGYNFTIDSSSTSSVSIYVKLTSAISCTGGTCTLQISGSNTGNNTGFSANTTFNTNYIGIGNCNAIAAGNNCWTRPFLNVSTGVTSSTYGGNTQLTWCGNATTGTTAC